MAASRKRRGGSTKGADSTKGGDSPRKGRASRKGRATRKKRASSKKGRKRSAESSSRTAEAEAEADAKAEADAMAGRAPGREAAREARGGSAEVEGQEIPASEPSERGSMATARRFARQARDARDASVARVRVLGSQARTLGNQARDLGTQARDSVAASLPSRAPSRMVPHLCFVQSPRRPIPPVTMSERVRVATYNVHRWQGPNGRATPDVARAGYVISELEADVIALQEVLRPYAGEAEEGEQPVDDPLARLCDELDLHLAFAVTRRHRRGQLGNAILSRFPITAISVLDISYSRIERRGALAAHIGSAGGGLGVVATHLSLVDRTRNRQVQSLLEHPALNSGAAVLMGDMNAWRKCKGSVALDESLGLHHNFHWPASFPAARPMLALDRIYTRGAAIAEVRQHDSPAARKASDHLPVVAEVEVGKGDELAPAEADFAPADAELAEESA